ncbi:hypothetical protein Hanom_Chr07g00675871 [Helianthus anomalus]
MVGLGLGHLVTRGMGAPHCLVTYLRGMVRRWLSLGWVHRVPNGLNLKFKLFICPAMTWRGQRIEPSQLGYQDRPTPDLKPKPQGPRPNPSPPGVVSWAFSPNPRQNPRPIPHGLIDFC